jgi:hypothetical protein
MAATHAIHKSSEALLKELRKVNTKLDKLERSSGLPKEVVKALVKLPKKLDNIAEEIEDCCDCWEDKPGDIKLADIGTSTETGKVLATAGINAPKDLVGTSAESSKAVARAVHQKIAQSNKGSAKIPSRKQILKLVIEARAKLKPA